MKQIVDALAVYRLTRFVTVDHLFEPARERIQKEIKQAHHAKLISVHTRDKLEYLLTCQWCMSIWIATLVLLASRYTPKLWNPISKMLAFSATAGFLSGYE